MVFLYIHFFYSKCSSFTHSDTFEDFRVSIWLGYIYAFCYCGSRFNSFRSGFLIFERGYDRTTGLRLYCMQLWSFFYPTKLVEFMKPFEGDCTQRPTSYWHYHMVGCSPIKLLSNFVGNGFHTCLKVGTRVMRSVV